MARIVNPEPADCLAALVQRRAECEELRAEVARLRGFISDFADAKFDALYQHPCSPEDEKDDVTEAAAVWAWQEDARAALTDGGGNG
jgi:hypothetical protein